MGFLALWQLLHPYHNSLKHHEHPPFSQCMHRHRSINLGQQLGEPLGCSSPWGGNPLNCVLGELYFLFYVDLVLI